MMKKSKFKLNVPLLGIGSLLVEQVVASVRSSFDQNNNYLHDVKRALEEISSDQILSSETGVSESLRTLSDLVQSELTMVTLESNDLQFSPSDFDGLTLDESSSLQKAFDDSSQTSSVNPILLAQADVNPNTANDFSNPVLAQLAQTTPQSLTESSAAKPAEKSAAITDVDSFNWPVVGAILGGVALVSQSNSDSQTIAPTQAPTSAPTQAPTSAPTDEPTNAPTTEGVLVDGYIVGATVFRDLNGDGILNDGEFSVVTGEVGVFSGLGGFGGSIVAFGGTDISTDLEFAGVLKAPDGAEVINPLTTLVHAVMGDTTGKSASDMSALLSAAEDKITSVLGIEPDLGSITKNDPIALIATGGPGAPAALQMQLKAIQVANVLVTLSQSITNSGVSSDANAAALLMSKALTNIINNASEGGLDLSSSSVINGLFASVISIATESGGVSSEAIASLQNVADQASNALAAINAAIDSIDLDSGIQGLKTAVAAQLVIVGENGLLNALRSGEEFSTDNLDQLINDNLDDVKDVVAPTAEPTAEPTAAPPDTVAPTVSFQVTKTTLKAGETTLVTITFSEAVTGFTLGDLSSDGGELSNLSVTSNPLIYEATFTPYDGIDRTTNIQFSGSYTDIAGNPGRLNQSVTIDVDSTELELSTPDENALYSIEGGTFNLNTSLGALSSMGIDTITGDSDTEVVVTGGIGGFNFAQTDLIFTDSGDEDLNVTLVLTGDDETGNGTVNLNTSLGALSSMGIDTITGDSDTEVVVTGGIGALDFAQTDLRFTDGDNGETDLDVTLQLSDAQIDAIATVNLSTTLSSLAAMGIDTIELNTNLSGLERFGTISGESDTEVVVTGGIGALDFAQTDLRFTDGDNGETDLDVTLQTSLDDLGTVNLSTNLTALADMGIDTIELDNSLNDLSGLSITGDNRTELVISQGFGNLTWDQLASLGVTFDQDLDVTVDVTANDLSALGLADVQATLHLDQSDEAAALRGMGIDFINVISDLDNDFDI